MNYVSAIFYQFQMTKILLIKLLKGQPFARLQKKEKREGGFIENSSKISNFFRSGRIGEGHEKFYKLQIKRINNGNNELLRVLKYNDVC